MDWKKLIADLSDVGWTQKQIAVELGHPQSWVSFHANSDSDVYWHDGERLRKLHSRVMRKRARANPAND